MIAVNLRPAASPRSSQTRLGRPSLNRLGPFDGWVALAALPWVFAPLAVAWLHVAAAREAGELGLDVRAAAADSTRYAAVIQAAVRLRARRDTLASRTEMIRSLDGARFERAHMLEEVRRALPARAWLTAIGETGDTTGAAPGLRLEGRARDPFALTAFMKALEESPFLAGVRLITTSVETEVDGPTHAFALELRYETPPPGAARTAPLSPGDGE